MRWQHSVRLAICVAALVPSSQALSADDPELSVAWNSIIDQGTIQIKAADRDLAMSDQTLKTFLKAYYDRPKSIKFVDSTLANLRHIFPDFRLRYRAVSDFCAIQAAIGDARSNALERKADGYAMQLKAQRLNRLYLLIKMNRQVAQIAGGDWDTILRRAFLEDLASETQSSAETSFSPSSYLGEDPCIKLSS